MTEKTSPGVNTRLRSVEGRRTVVEGGICTVVTCNVVLTSRSLGCTRIVGRSLDLFTMLSLN